MNRSRENFVTPGEPFTCSLWRPVRVLMKYVFIEKHQAEFSIKAMCRVLQIAHSGWYIWHQRRHQINRRQQFRLVCDNLVREAFSDAKQRYGAARLTDV